MNLTLIEDGRLGSGPDRSKWDKVYRYEVRGLPPGEQAWIVDFDFSWQILRVKDGQGKWMGSYTTADEALAALEGSLTAA